MTPKFYGQVVKGMVVLMNKDQYEKHKMSLEGQKIELVIRRQMKGRSNNQNRYYWGVAIPLLCDALGWEDPEEMHDAMKQMFLTSQRDGIRYSPSTTRLSTTDFMSYIAKIQQFAAEHHIIIPDPNQIDL